MTDWSLERDIADALGWHIIELIPPVVVHDDVTGHDITVRYEIVGKNGERLSGDHELAGRWQTEAGCWEHAPYEDWLTDIGEALKLAEYFRVKLTINFPRGTSDWHVRPDINGEIDMCALEDLAERICVHVLAWVNARNGVDNGTQSHSG